VTVAVVEVDRQWLRFQQLGCNEDGVLELEVLDRPPATNNTFAKQVMQRLFFVCMYACMYVCFTSSLKLIFAQAWAGSASEKLP